MAAVLMVRLDNTGDVLLTGPAVRTVASQASVVYVCHPASRPAAQLLPGVDDTIDFRAPWIEADPDPVSAPAIDRFVAAVRRARPDRAIVLTSFHQSPLPVALLLRLAGVPHISAISDDYPGSLLDVRVRVSDDIHEVERSLALVDEAGFAPLPDRRLGIRPVAPFGGDLPDRYVVVHLGASVPARAWSVDKTVEAVGALLEAGHDVVLTGGAPSGFDRQPGLHDVSGQTSLSDLAAVLERADAVVSGNTGPAHLAAAVGTPVVSIYAPTVPAVRWHPWMVPHVLLGEQDIACAGCRARVCPVRGHPCVEDIPIASVVDAVGSLVPTGVAA